MLHIVSVSAISLRGYMQVSIHCAFLGVQHNHSKVLAQADQSACCNVAAMSWKRPAAEPPAGAGAAPAGRPAWCRPLPESDDVGSIAGAGPSWLRPAAESPPAPHPASHSGETQACCKFQKVCAGPLHRPAWCFPPAEGSRDQVAIGQQLPGAERPPWCTPALDSTTASASSVPSGRREARLSIGPLLLANQQPSSECTSYSRAAMDADKVQAALATPQCECKCGTGIPEEQLCHYMSVFHRLSWDDKCQYLQAVYEEDPIGGPTDWYLLGNHVCVPRLCQLFHMGKTSWYRAIHGTPDGRASNHSTSTVDLTVDQFFLELYNSAAETLPEEALERVTGVDDTIDNSVKDEGPDQCSPCLAPGAAAAREVPTLSPCWDPAGACLEQLRELGSQGPASSVQLPVKHLHHQHIMDLRWLYLAWMKLMPGKKPASWATFHRRWQSRWKHCLCLRKSSQHSQCEACARYSNALYFSHLSYTEKKKLALDWQQHLRGQQHDRLIYWHARWWSRRRANVLTIIIDAPSLDYPPAVLLNLAPKLLPAPAGLHIFCFDLIEFHTGGRACAAGKCKMNCGNTK